MYNGNVKSLKTVLWKVMNHPLAAELNYDLAAEFALEGIRLIGAPLSLVNRVSEPIKLQSHKAALPIDIVELKQVRYFYNIDDDESCKISMTLATDTFHNKVLCDTDDGCEYTYVAEEGIIKTSLNDGYVEVAYRALPIDEDGFPLIPDNQKVLLAIEYYILFRYLGPLYDIGKITDRAWNRIETSKCFYISSASNDMKIQNYDHVEAIMNGINRIITQPAAHSNFFKGTGIKEQFKRY
jgi:hypothetical protein